MELEAVRTKEWFEKSWVLHEWLWVWPVQANKTVQDLGTAQNPGSSFHPAAGAQGQGAQTLWASPCLWINEVELDGSEVSFQLLGSLILHHYHRSWK